MPIINNLPQGGGGVNPSTISGHDTGRGWKRTVERTFIPVRLLSISVAAFSNNDPNLESVEISVKVNDNWVICNNYNGSETRQKGSMDYMKTIGVVWANSKTYKSSRISGIRCVYTDPYRDGNNGIQVFATLG